MHIPKCIWRRSPVLFSLLMLSDDFMFTAFNVHCFLQFFFHSFHDSNNLYTYSSTSSNCTSGDPGEEETREQPWYVSIKTHFWSIYRETTTNTNFPPCFNSLHFSTSHHFFRCLYYWYAHPPTFTPCGQRCLIKTRRACWVCSGNVHVSARDYPHTSASVAS